MKRFKSTMFWVSLHVLLFAIYFISRSNVKMISVADCDKSTPAVMGVLSEMVESNFLDREYYEVFARSKKYPCTIFNYNTEYQVLSISTDPGSGWSYHLEATPDQLKSIAENKLTLNQIIQLLNPVPRNKIQNYPNG